MVFSNNYCMDKLIVTTCGDSNIKFNAEEIGNDPNFVFVNDPNYETIILYNQEGNIINVNSWLECANYVNGGWTPDALDLFNGEQYLFFTMFFLTIAYKLIKKLLVAKR